MHRVAHLGLATEQAIITHSNEHVRTADRQALPPAIHTHTPHTSDKNTLGTDASTYTHMDSHTQTRKHTHTLHVAVWERSINGPAGRQAPYGSAVLSWSSLYACHVSVQQHTHTATHTPKHLSPRIFFLTVLSTHTHTHLSLPNHVLTLKV